MTESAGKSKRSTATSAVTAYSNCEGYIFKGCDVDTTVSSYFSPTLISVAISGWPFGFASAPYDPQWAMRHPRRAAWMALAGPGSNLLLVLIAWVLIRAGSFGGLFQPPSSVRFGHVIATDGGGWLAGVAFMIGAFFCMNLALAILNLIPLPPLDGSAAIPLVLSPSLTQRYQHFLWTNPGLAIFGMLAAWRVFDVIFQPMFMTAVNLLFPGVRYG